MTSISAKSVVRHGRLQDRHELLLVTGETARDERRAETESHGHGVDGRQHVRLALLRARANVGRGRHLALRESVDTVVLDDVDHLHVASDAVHEVTQADGQRVAITGDPDVGQFAVRGDRPGGDGDHPAVRGVEAVSSSHEVRGRLRGAADTAQLGDHVGWCREFPERVHDGCRDRVVTTAGTER